MTRQGGGGVSPSQKTVKLGENYGDLPTLTRTGYTFSGWKNGDITVTASTQNTTVGDHTLTAQWTPNNYNIIFYENKNILLGGQFHEDSDREQGWYSTRKKVLGIFAGAFHAQIVEKDNLSCAKIKGESGTEKYIQQNIYGKIKFGTEYIVTLKCRVDNYVAGTTNPLFAIYTSGYYNNNGTSTWYDVGLNQSLTDYNNAGWTDIYYHRTTTSTASSSTATSALAYIYARDFTGDLYFRDFSIAEATHTTRTVTYDSVPGGAPVLTYSGTTENKTSLQSIEGNFTDYPFGYNFLGYFTQPIGGTKVYNADGSIVKGLSDYTDSNGKWIRTAGVNLYAQWEQWPYLPDSAKATLTNTQALQNSSGGRNKRVAKVDVPSINGGTRKNRYIFNGTTSYGSEASYLLTLTEEGSESLYVQTYPASGEKYMGVAERYTGVYLEKLPTPQTYMHCYPNVFGGNGWWNQVKRMVGGAYVVGWTTCDDNPKYTANNKGVWQDDDWHEVAGSHTYMIAFASWCDVNAYHYLNGFIDSDTVTDSNGSNSKFDRYSGNKTYYTANDNGLITEAS